MRIRELEDGIYTCVSCRRRLEISNEGKRMDFSPRPIGPGRSAHICDWQPVEESSPAEIKGKPAPFCTELMGDCL